MSNTAKSYFAMARGINTEAPLVNFPDGFTTDEQNYELTIKGERRRRLGLAIETGGTELSISNYAAGDVVRVFDWENVSGIPTINMEVMQVGYMLYIFDDDNPTSPTRRSTSISILPYKTTDATSTQVSTWPLEYAFGRGHLFLFGKYTSPIYIDYDPEEDSFTVNQINIVERDFEGINDGYSNSSQPSSAIDSHTYNLKNRGWTDAFIASFQADQSRQPSKAMIPWLGLKRALTPGNSYDDDGIRGFSPAKLVSEIFQDASAPTGHFIKTPFDTTTVPETNLGIAIASWSISGFTPGPQTLTVNTTDVHGVAPSDTVTIVNLIGTFISEVGSLGEYVVQALVVNGNYTVVTTPDTDTLTVVVEFPNFPFVDWLDTVTYLGTLVGGTVPNASGEVVDFRPKAGAFFAGRAWYAGIDTARLTGRVYFSQVIESDVQYAKCYQVADPTDERISDLAPADGGVIIIPEASNVVKLLPYNSSLIVFASNGVWEIGPGDLGYFAATSYSVRKLSDSGAASPGSIVLADGILTYWGITDIYTISPDPRSGYLVTSNVSQATINTLYNNIPLANRRESIGVYDDLGKRIIWLYRSEDSDVGYSYDKGLVFDLRMNAWIPYAFATSATDYLAGIFVLKEAGEVSKIKYLGIVDDELIIGEANNYDDYTDFGISEPDAYMVTGYDSLRAPSDFKYAPVVWVFSRKTETGFDDDLNPIRPSSTSMQARWEWADNASAGRWGREQEVYRHQRAYVPTGVEDGFDDGIPVVVTKNKLRGKGRVLQLRFTAGTGTDSWLMGWKTNFTRIEK